MFIAGMCRIWSKKQGGYWVTMPYAARGYSDCERLVRTEDRFGSLYQYAITADHDLCRPCDWTLCRLTPALVLCVHYIPCMSNLTYVPSVTTDVELKLGLKNSCSCASHNEQWLQDKMKSTPSPCCDYGFSSCSYLLADLEDHRLTGNPGLFSVEFICDMHINSWCVYTPRLTKSSAYGTPTTKQRHTSMIMLIYSKGIAVVGLSIPSISLRSISWELSPVNTGSFLLCHSFLTHSYASPCNSLQAHEDGNLSARDFLCCWRDAAMLPIGGGDLKVISALDKHLRNIYSPLSAMGIRLKFLLRDAYLRSLGVSTPFAGAASPWQSCCLRTSPANAGWVFSCPIGHVHLCNSFTWNFRSWMRPCLCVSSSAWIPWTSSNDIFDVGVEQADGSIDSIAVGGSFSRQSLRQANEAVDNKIAKVARLQLGLIQ